MLLKLNVRRIVTPLVATPAYEFQTFLTVLKQTHGINAKVMDADKNTVISHDLCLYKPAKQLQMCRNDLDLIILRPGELHFHMAMLRTLGAYIDGIG